jgi:serine/threonine-protein kinase
MMIQPKSLINGRYRVGRRLGEGGMAIVFLGHDLLLGRDVAIKTLRPQYAADPAFRARFERESRAAASLSHPNIIDVHDVGDEDGTPYLVMELVRGQTLKEIIAADAPFHPDDVAELLAQIGGALDYAHARGYVHRDVKPGNILVDGHGRARLVDFGIAKGLADADLTEQGSGLGTVGYISPEQAEGLMATPASDVYSVGVVAYERLTGELPFSAETPVGLAMRHVNDPVLPPSRHIPGLAPQVDAVVLRALDKDPTRRWPSVVDFSRALRDWQQGAPRQAEVFEQPTSPPPRGSLAPTIVILVLVIGALAALLWTGFRNLPTTPANEAPATVLVPPEPVITGEFDDDEPAGAAIEPTDVPQQDVPVIVPQQDVAPRTAPTIAPAADTTTAQAQDSVTVPNLVGLTISGATQALGPLGLRIVPGQPMFTDSIPFNAVAAQDPPAGTVVSAGESIRVSLSRGPSPFGNDDAP